MNFHSSSTLLLAFGIVFVATPACAGFQWVPPEERSATASSVQTYALPPAPSPMATTTLPEIISPVIISGTPAPAPAAPPPSLVPSAPPSLVVPISSAKPAAEPPPAAPPAPPARTTSQAVPAPVPPAPVPTSEPEPAPDIATSTISIAPSVKPAPSAGIVQGFASRVPLALALRQLLPVGYSFSIDPGVDMNTLVSYKGGKPWSETLGTMLASAGLKYQEHDKVIEVSRLPAPPVAVPEPTPAVAQPKMVPIPPPASKPMVLMPPISSLPTLSSPTSLPSVNVPPADGWSAERGNTLRKVFTDWCKRAGVELQWKAEYDYPIEASAHFQGDFENAVRNLLSGFDGARPQPVGELYANAGAGQKVLVIQARGNSYSN